MNRNVIHIETLVLADQIGNLCTDTRGLSLQSGVIAIAGLSTQNHLGQLKAGRISELTAQVEEDPQALSRGLNRNQLQNGMLLNIILDLDKGIALLIL